MPQSGPRAVFLSFISVLLCGCASLLPVPVAGDVLFQDDFSRTASGWDRVHAPDHIIDYIDGGYHVSISTPDLIVWGRPHLEFENVLMHVDLQMLTGSEDNIFGAICRFQNPQNYIFFTISSDGFAGIGAIVDGEEQMLHADAMHPSDAVIEGQEPNHMMATCIHEELTLSVNGMPILSATAPFLTAGDVGVLAGSRSEAPVEIRFEHFSVQQP